MKCKKLPLLFPIFTVLFLGFFLSSASAITLVQRSSEPVFSTGEPHPWDREEVEGSSILYENGKYRMWYTGYDGKIYRIGLAESLDGVSWEKLPHPVLEPEFKEEYQGKGMGQPTVIHDGDLYKMWFTMTDEEGSMIGYATSKDGVRWKKREFSVLNSQHYYFWPAREMYNPFVVKDGGTYRMWFVGYDGSYSIGHAVSKDGIQWKPHADAPVNFPRNEEGSKKTDRSHPFVRINNQGLYEMWYTEMEGKGWVIRHASSADGVHWEPSGEKLNIPKGKKGTWDSTGVYKPMALTQNGKHMMWYSATGGYRVRVGMATSMDGKNWTKFEANPVVNVSEGKGWESSSLNGGTLLKDGKLFKMWYSGYNGSKIRIGVAVSRDGLLWNKEQTNPVLQTGREGEWDKMGVAYPSVLIDEKGVYWMWYLGYDGSNTNVGVATSANGIHWVKNESNPVLSKGEKGEWDGFRVAYASVIRDQGIFKMWYAGSNGEATRIGLATSKDGIHWEKWKGNPVLKEGKAGDTLSVSFPMALREGEGYRLWYAGLGEKGHRIFEAASKDGIHWIKKGEGKPVLDVVDKSGRIKEVKGPMVCKDGNRYWMAYEELGENTNLIALASSEDGTQWTPYRRSYAIDVGVGDGWDSYGVARGWVVKDTAKGIYRMWYSGHDGNTFRIGSASSIGGLQWTRYAHNPVIDRGPLGTWDSERVTYPSVIMENGTFKMWYHGFGVGTSPRIGFATSTDGIHWEKHGMDGIFIPGKRGWDSFAVGYPSVIKDGDLYRMWYSGLDRNYGTWRIGYVESKDGIHWEKNGEDPALDVGAEGDWDGTSVSYPMVIKDGTGFIMFYVGFGSQTFRIGVATSPDGIQWKKTDNNPLITNGMKDSFDAGSALAPMVIKEEGKYRIWYTGIQKGRYQIGYAEAMEGEIMAGFLGR